MGVLINVQLLNLWHIQIEYKLFSPIISETNGHCCWKKIYLLIFFPEMAEFVNNIVDCGSLCIVQILFYVFASASFWLKHDTNYSKIIHLVFD